MSECEELVETMANQKDCRTHKISGQGWLPVIFYHTILHNLE